MQTQGKSSRVLSSSFRDPSGFVFVRDGTIYRQMHQSYQSHYDLLMRSGCAAALIRDHLLIEHEKVSLALAHDKRATTVIRPRVLDFISYPYEWCFSQLKDAALATLAIQRRALDFGMTLKDASAYNIQFIDGKPLLIDTSSFEAYREGQPWVAYRQFCQHFLAPLALASYGDVRLQQMLRSFLDGIPLDLAARLLPARARLCTGLFMHIFLHANSQRHFEKGTARVRRGAQTVSRHALLGILESLESTIRGLHWEPSGTAWAQYRVHESYTSAAFADKRRLVEEYLDTVQPKTV